MTINHGLLDKAIRLAYTCHKDQTRKGDDSPYMTHPLTVAMILARVTNDENIIIAGILHDTIEDCKPSGSVTKELLEKEFNGDVARMVNDVTEQDKTLPWMERKIAALKHIQHMKHDSILVKSADLLHNLTDLNENIRVKPEIAFKYFHASKKDVILRYKMVIPELRKYSPKNPLIEELDLVLATLLKLTIE